MKSLGKNKQGLRLYISDEDVANAAKNPLEYKKGLNNQQWARLRKMIRNYLKKNSNNPID